MPEGTFIFKDTIVNFVIGNRPTAFVIISRQIAENYRKFFNQMWTQAKD
ncbi:MAG: hypothetical protein ABH828_03280 [archaeon]